MWVRAFGATLYLPRAFIFPRFYLDLSTAIAAENSVSHKFEVSFLISVCTSIMWFQNPKRCSNNERMEILRHASPLKCSVPRGLGTGAIGHFGFLG